MEKYLNFKERIEYDKLNEVANKIRTGGIVIFPTDTVYGIGADCFNEIAIQKIYEIKKRPREKAISLLISNLSMIDEIAINISKEEKKIMEIFFPGPLTIILSKNPRISDTLTAGKDTVGVRMPQNEIALNLIEKVRKTTCYS